MANWVVFALLPFFSAVLAALGIGFIASLDATTAQAVMVSLGMEGAKPALVGGMVGFVVGLLRPFTINTSHNTYGNTHDGNTTVERTDDSTHIHHHYHNGTKDEDEPPYQGGEEPPPCKHCGRYNDEELPKQEDDQ